MSLPLAEFYNNLSLPKPIPAQLLLIAAAKRDDLEHYKYMRAVIMGGREDDFMFSWEEDDDMTVVDLTAVVSAGSVKLAAEVSKLLPWLAIDRLALSDYWLITATNGHTQMMAWLIMQNIPVHKRTSLVAVETNRPNVIYWMHDNKLYIHPLTLIYAAKAGCLRLVQRMVALGYECDELVVSGAAWGCANGNFDTLKWLIDHNYKITEHVIPALARVYKANDIKPACEMIEYILRREPRAMTWLAYHWARSELKKWILDKYGDDDWTAYDFSLNLGCDECVDSR